jgi:RNA polymerase sigma-70 factor (ECF subfamily)
LKEQYRSGGRDTSLDDGDPEKDFPARGIGMLDAMEARQAEGKVREILDKLPERDRRLLREVFLEERDKDDVCRDFGVDREYLRVLLHRAKQAFKSLYLESMDDLPTFGEARGF